MYNLVTGILSSGGTVHFMRGAKATPFYRYLLPLLARAHVLRVRACALRLAEARNHVLQFRCFILRLADVRDRLLRLQVFGVRFHLTAFLLDVLRLLLDGFTLLLYDIKINGHRRTSNSQHHGGQYPQESLVTSLHRSAPFRAICWSRDSYSSVTTGLICLFQSHRSS